MHVPQVHAFNVLRFVFADKELTTETIGFAAKGLTAAISGFSSPHWEVRFLFFFFLRLRFRRLPRTSEKC